MHGVASPGLTRAGAQHLGLANVCCRRLFGACVARCTDATSSVPISRYKAIATPIAAFRVVSGNQVKN
jgi:hypothetical protein